MISNATNILRQGGVVAIPTDTLYGLAACALNDTAVKKVFSIKRRCARAPIPILLAGIEDVDRYAVNIPDLAWLLTEHFWPGALTLVFQRSDLISDFITGGSDKVALRVPRHEIPRAITKELGWPITGTSANRSGEPGIDNARTVQSKLGMEVDLVIDGGKASEGSPSTVLDITSDMPVILRQGSVSKTEIERICGFEILTHLV